MVRKTLIPRLSAWSLMRSISRRVSVKITSASGWQIPCARRRIVHRVFSSTFYRIRFQVANLPCQVVIAVFEGLQRNL